MALFRLIAEVEDLVKVKDKSDELGDFTKGSGIDCFDFNDISMRRKEINRSELNGINLTTDGFLISQCKESWPMANGVCNWTDLDKAGRPIIRGCAYD